MYIDTIFFIFANGFEGEDTSRTFPGSLCLNKIIIIIIIHLLILPHQRVFHKFISKKLNEIELSFEHFPWVNYDFQIKFF